MVPAVSSWILLRGLTREARHWGEFPAIFRSAITDAELITIDLPGNGRLHKMASPASVSEMAEFCRAEVRRLNLLPPYHILAMSLGAMVAVAWAAEQPQELAACVLINTSLRPFSPFYRRLKPQNYPALLKLALLGGDEREWERLILRLTSNQVEKHQEVLDAWLSYRREYPVSSANALRQLFAASRYRAPATAPSVPLLILASSKDALVDVRCSQHIALCWHADIAEHAMAGHDIPLDDGPWVAARVRDWLKT